MDSPALRNGIMDARLQSSSPITRILCVKSEDCPHFFIGAGFYFQRSPLIKDVRMPLFALAVFYVGLFSLFGDKKN